MTLFPPSESPNHEYSLKLKMILLGNKRNLRIPSDDTGWIRNENKDLGCNLVEAIIKIG